MKFIRSSAISKGLGNALQTIAEIGPLPFIRGTWFYVDPQYGSDNSDGRTIDTALATKPEAYDRCTSGYNDGICLLARASSTAYSTSYLKTAMTWAKNDIVVWGACAPTRMYPRARIANQKITTTATLTVAAGALKIITRAAGSFITDGWVVGMTALTAGDQTVSSVVTAVAALSLTVTDNLTASAGKITSVTSTVVDLITITGSNNSFYNVGFWNGGSSATEIGGLKITGHRNYFENCHITGGAGTSGATVKSLYLSAAQDNNFVNCVIGTDTVDRGDNASVEILLEGNVARNEFHRNRIVSWVTAGTAHGAVKSSGTDGGRPTYFQDCAFDSGFSTTTPADVHLVSGSVCKPEMKNCAAFNFTGWGASVYVDSPTSAASAAGGLATTE